MPVLTYTFDTYYQPPEPVLAIQIDNLPSILPMLVDTGAHRTTFPSKWAKQLGHDNIAPKVLTGKTVGVGGSSKHYIHTLNIKFLDNDINPIWETGKIEVVFSDQMDMFHYGLIGRDICCDKWNKIIFDTSNKDCMLWTMTIDFPDS